MVFNFEKLGNVDSGTVELGDLTIICGPNNVGKTYISYAIYGFLRQCKELLDFSLPKDSISRLIKDGVLHIELKEYKKQLPKLFEDASAKFSSSLTSFFNVSDNFFDLAELRFNLKHELNMGTKEYKSVEHFGENVELDFYKADNDSVLSISIKIKSLTGKILPHRILESVINEKIADCILGEFIPQPFVVTSERTGIALFYKELDISRNSLLEYISDKENLNFFEILSVLRSRYAKPIYDNINVVRDYENLSKLKSFICEDPEYKPVKQALQDLMGGTYKSQNKQVVYLPKKERGRRKVAIPVYVASSSIKSLFLINLYINSLATKGGILIIDEPELNLHPDNQRKMARLLSRLVNSGVKVLITTHSDYIIREFNNAVMLNLDVEGKTEIMKSERMCDLDLLRPDQIKAYVVKNDHRIYEANVDKYGINLGVFDELIAKSNDLTDRIYYGIEE